MHALKIETLGDMRVTLSALLGSAHASIREILEFRPGSVVPLHVSAESAIPLLVNGVAVARGEIVTLENGCLAIHILDVSVPEFEGIHE